MLATLSSFLRSLLTPYDISDALDDLTMTVQEELDLVGAGVSIARDVSSARGAELRFATANPSALVELETYQEDEQAGPCVEAFRCRSTVAIDDLREHADRWPRYCSIAVEMGITSVAGIPMKVGDRTIGALNAYAVDRRWSDQDLSVATIFADAASVYLVNSVAYDRQRTINTQLQEALSSRIVIEQAKGIIAETHGAGVDEAFELIRRHARGTRSSLREVAEQVVHRRLRL
ncbi:GAF and ANTAR domain-containing protein [Pseudactinotalea sp. Z1732]|uniref:GAF and ANTAR domain-containing protein n=1 Tax=Micrococcales TaxID=85006 RepID=UPI003C7AA682